MTRRPYRLLFEEGARLGGVPESGVERGGASSGRVRPGDTLAMPFDNEVGLGVRTSFDSRRLGGRVHQCVVTRLERVTSYDTTGLECGSRVLQELRAGFLGVHA